MEKGALPDTQVRRVGASPAPGKGWGGGLTHAGPASSGRVGVRGRQAAAGVGALEVDALGGRRAVVLQAVRTLVPVCGRERDGTGAREKGQRLLRKRMGTEQSPP